jgi:hypothetical protein
VIPNSIFPKNRGLREHRLNRVVIQQIRDQEQRSLRKTTHFADGVLQLPQRGSDGALPGRQLPRRAAIPQG